MITCQLCINFDRWASQQNPTNKPYACVCGEWTIPTVDRGHLALHCTVCTFVNFACTYQLQNRIQGFVPAPLCSEPDEVEIRCPVHFHMVTAQTKQLDTSIGDLPCGMFTGRGLVMEIHKRIREAMRG